jgi:tripartite-type tricarboxylate transporter receptor subunit TctC
MVFSRSSLAAVLAAVALCAHAEGFPAKPVHAIISFTPGSSTDIVGRIVMQKVSEYWGPRTARARAARSAPRSSRARRRTATRC